VFIFCVLLFLLSSFHAPPKLLGLKTNEDKNTTTTTTTTTTTKVKKE
jgi:hypothetical protein